MNAHAEQLDQARAFVASIAEGHHVQFSYTNWRGDDHLYVIAPRGVEYGRFNGAETDRWYLHGLIVARDGQVRTGLARNLRRSFEIAGIRDCWTMPRGGDGDGC